MKRYLRDDDANSEDDVHEEADEIHDSSRPALLFYSGRVLSQEELIADLPERTLSDRLISRFLNSGDPSLGMCTASRYITKEQRLILLLHRQ